MKILILSFICTILVVSCERNDASNSAPSHTSSNPYAEKLSGNWKLKSMINLQTGVEDNSLANGLNQGSLLSETWFLNFKNDECTLIKICAGPLTNNITKVSVSSKYSISDDELEIHENQSEIIGNCEASLIQGKFKYSISNDIFILNDSKNETGNKFIRVK